MIDTNVFMSALMFPDSVPSRAVKLVLRQHELVLCDYLIDEIKEKIQEKRPDLIPALDDLLRTISFQKVVGFGDGSVEMNDPKDIPILDAAIAGDVDIIVSGDKHFRNLDRVRPKVNSPAEFVEANK
jgi:putative PIN family toxin of toxin-antitoxin system